MRRCHWSYPSTLVVVFLVAAVLGACGGTSNSPAPPDYLVSIASVPQVESQRIVASPDGNAWLVWTEDDTATESVVAARVDSAGNVARSLVSQAIQGAQRDVQIVMSGASPIVAWREYSSAGVRVRVSAEMAGHWVGEFEADASNDGGIHLIVQSRGTVSLVWQRADVAGGAELMASQRTIGGAWASPVVVARAPSGVTMGLPRHTAGLDDAMLVIWTEEPAAVNGVLQPQILWSSRFDPTAGAWDIATTVDDGNGRYYSYAIAPSARSEWVVAWAAGSPIRQSTLLAKRGSGTTWDPTPTRIDVGDDYTIREVALAAADSAIVVAWTGLSEFISPGSVRSARFDVPGHAWTVPTLIGGAVQGYPVWLRLVGIPGGSALATWNISQGAVGGPLLALLGAAGQWQAPLVIDPDGTGLAADLSPFSAYDVVAAWYRLAPQNRTDIVVRRFPLRK